ncbi:MAG: histidinol-phosphatase HisJ family protein [Culicoidibacterales bacterium]
MRVEQLFDHHMHSEFSADSTQNLDMLVQQAIQMGKSAFVTTEHYEPIFQETGFFCVDIPKYCQKMTALQEKYPEITIYRGIEIGYETQVAQDVQALIDSQQFDLIIISIHTLAGGQDVAGTYKKHGYWPFSADPIQQYLEAAVEAVTTLEHFQIFGHLDYILRYVDRSGFSVSKYRIVFEQFFAKLIEKQIALDLNTSGWRYGLGYAHPQPEILALYREMGGERICLGSDAHKIEDVNADFMQALQVLQNLGFEAITSYETGRSQQIRIADIIA